MIKLSINFYLKRLKMPCKCSIVFKDISNESIVQNITAIQIKNYGFNTKGGGWALYSQGNDDTPASFLVYKKYKKRKQSTININDIISVLDYK